MSGLTSETGPALLLALLPALLLVACGADPAPAPDRSGDDPIFVSAAPEPGYVATIEEMYHAAPLVVLADVLAVEPGEELAVGAHPEEDSFLVMGHYTLRVERALKGSPEQTITVRRESFMTTGEGLRPIALEGITPNEVGDRVLWFLEPSGDPAAPWRSFRLQGVFEVEDGVVVSELDVDHGPAHALDGLPLDDVLGRLGLPDA